MGTSTVQPKRKYTVAEYLELERAATEKHEYDNGEILAMSGASFEHTQVATNINGELRNRLRGKSCQPLNSDMRVRIAAAGQYVYPDLTVLCGPPEFDPDDDKRMTLLNPAVIVEVLSFSTERYDRGEKFLAYQKLSSLKEYVMVSQWQPHVETYRRHEDGRWTIRSFEGVDALLELPSVDISIPLSEIYLNVQFQLDPRPHPDPRELL